MADKDPLSPEVLFAHVQDSPGFHLPESLGGHHHLPQPFAGVEPLWDGKTGLAMIDDLHIIQPLDLVFTKFMVLEVVAALLIAVFFIGLALRIRWGGPPKGRFWNMLEAMYFFIRDEVARPSIGKDDADKFLPFLLTLFFFVLACNLLGMVPWLGAPTAALATTGALAFSIFLVVVGTGVAKMGPIGFLKAQVPHMDLPAPVAVLLVPMIFVIEIFGMFVKHFVLAVRLLANMIAGHIVLGVIIAFISVSWTSMAVYGVVPLSVVSGVAISLLELFVAFLQAYIFTFLAALFIGAAVHPH